MVRCAKCGAENREGSQYSAQCGAALQPSRVRREKYELREIDACFGGARPVKYFWLIIGLLIILWGIFQLLETYFKITIPLWPLVLIAIGLYIIYRVLSRSWRIYSTFIET